MSDDEAVFVGVPKNATAKTVVGRERCAVASLGLVKQRAATHFAQGIRDRDRLGMGISALELRRGLCGEAPTLERAVAGRPAGEGPVFCERVGSGWGDRGVCGGRR